MQALDREFVGIVYQHDSSGRLQPVIPHLQLGRLVPATQRPPALHAFPFQEQMGVACELWHPLLRL